MRRYGLLDASDLANNPSVCDGIPPDKVQEYVRKTLIFIKQLGATLKLRLVSVSTAQVFLHRFYARQSFKTHDRWIVGTTCVFLAAKVEEDQRKLDQVMDAYNAVRSMDETRTGPLEARQRKEKVLLCERILLHTMGFDISVEHPHSEGLRMIKQLNARDSELKQVVWNILNDSLNTNVCIRFEPRMIAAAAIVLAAQFLRGRGEGRQQTIDPSTPLGRVLQAVTSMEDQGAVFGYPAESLPSVIDALLDAYEQDNPGGPVSQTIRRHGSFP